ncbi:hypothetical protein L218DRAFT_1017950, partial [Marasmius fiardii PR-910]
PVTPFTFLTPDISNQFEIPRYLYAVTLGGYIWDCAINLESDYRLLFKHRIPYPTVIYYLSSFCPLSLIVQSNFLLHVKAGNVSSCQTLQLTLGIFYVLTTAFTALLFLLRVIAVWIMNKWIIASFTILWVSTVGGAVTVPFGISGGHIGPACINTQIDSYAQSAAIVPMIYDSAVFLAITYRILMNSLLEEASFSRFPTFFWRGRGFFPTLFRNFFWSWPAFFFLGFPLLFTVF